MWDGLGDQDASSTESTLNPHPLDYLKGTGSGTASELQLD